MPVRDSGLIYSSCPLQKGLPLDAHLKKELTDYCFVLKVTRVFPIPTQAEQTDDGEHFAKD